MWTAVWDAILPSTIQQTHLLLRHGSFPDQTYDHVSRWHSAYSSVQTPQTVPFAGGGKQVQVWVVRLITPKETPAAILGPPFGIVLSYSVLCAISHLTLFTANYLRNKKGRGKENTKLSVF